MKKLNTIESKSVVGGGVLSNLADTMDTTGAILEVVGGKKDGTSTGGSKKGASGGGGGKKGK